MKTLSLDWLLVAGVVVIALLALAAWFLFQKRKQSARLQQRFGAEYDRTVGQLGGRTQAESELKAREKRLEHLTIAPLAPADAARFSQAWSALQGRFVDNPKGVVVQADQLIREVMLKRGYPMGDFERRAADISVDHPDVVENYRAGSLDRWNLSLESLRAANPRLVTATLTGYPPGDTRPGYDFIAQADTGVMSLIGEPDGAPHKVGYPVSDMSAGLFLLSGVLAALYQRERTGRGQHLTVSIWEAQVAVQVNVNQSFLMTKAQPRRLGNAHPQVAPYEMIRVADGFIAVAVANDRQFGHLMSALGLAGRSGDPRFDSNAGRITHRAELTAEIESATSALGSRQALDLLRRHDIACAAIRTIDEVLTSEEARLAGTVVTLDHPTVGEVPVVRLPWRFSEASSAPRTPPPLLGEHNHVADEILAADRAPAQIPMPASKRSR